MANEITNHSDLEAAGRRHAADLEGADAFLTSLIKCPDSFTRDLGVPVSAAATAVSENAAAARRMIAATMASVDALMKESRISVGS